MSGASVWWSNCMRPNCGPSDRLQFKSSLCLHFINELIPQLCADFLLGWLTIST